MVSSGNQALTFSPHVNPSLARSTTAKLPLSTEANPVILPAQPLHSDEDSQSDEEVRANSTPSWSHSKSARRGEVDRSPNFFGDEENPMECTVATQTNTLYDSDAANSNSFSCDLLSHISEREEEYEDKFCRVDSHSTRVEPSA